MPTAPQKFITLTASGLAQQSSASVSGTPYALLALSATGQIDPSFFPLPAIQTATPASQDMITALNGTGTLIIEGATTLVALQINTPAVPEFNSLTIQFQVRAEALFIQAATGFTVNPPVSNIPISAGSTITLTLVGTTWI